MAIVEIAILGSLVIVSDTGPVELPAAKAWQRKLAQKPTLLRQAVLAAGAIGDPELVPWLLEQMKTPPVARVAGNGQPPPAADATAPAVQRDRHDAVVRVMAHQIRQGLRQLCGITESDDGIARGQE